MTVVQWSQGLENGPAATSYIRKGLRDAGQACTGESHEVQVLWDVHIQSAERGNVLFRTVSWLNKLLWKD